MPDSSLSSGNFILVTIALVVGRSGLQAVGDHLQRAVHPVLTSNYDVAGHEVLLGRA